MNHHERTNAVSIRCMDARHTRAYDLALEHAIGKPIKAYEVTAAGGAGILNGLQGSAGKEFFLQQIRMGLELGCNEIYLSAHGSSAADSHGCGGYTLKGHKDFFDDPERSHDELCTELKGALAVIKKEFQSIPVRAFYVTFDQHGANLFEEVIL